MNPRLRLTRTPNSLMNQDASVVMTAEMAGPDPRVATAHRLGLVALIVVSAWCGLVAGLLEVATIVIRKQFFDTNQLYGTTRHFVWLIPLLNLSVFLVLSAAGCVLILIWPHRGRWLILRTLCALTLLPIGLVAGPRIYALAWLTVTLGLASRIVPWLERRASGFRRVIRTSLPLLVATVAVFWGSLWMIDRARQARSTAAPVPPAGSPNLLLIVMDTVAADHLSLYGHDRATSTTLNQLADRGIRFDTAQSASSWTLPSHAAMFTGHWMHKLSVGWQTPLDSAEPTVAEFLTDRGYATAGFVANTSYAASDSGLGRGFTQYHDFFFPRLTAFKRIVLFSRAMLAVQMIVEFLDDSFQIARAKQLVQPLWRWLDVDRKTAADVNGQLLNWLPNRPQPERPFFAFLNYFDAHYPYNLPAGNYHRFGGSPADTRQRVMIDKWGELDKRPLSRQEVAFAASAYDDCIADLDEQIGLLVDNLKRSGTLDRTWLFIVADHGESFGEHTDIFCHGTSLYQTEIHVPLVIVPPGGAASKQVVKEAVSLRDLAATIVDVTGQKSEAPFPGQSLARFWNDPKRASPIQPGLAEPALAEVVPNPNAPGNKDDSGVARPTWPLGTIHDTEWSYIRREGDVREELFKMSVDRKQEHNLAADPTAAQALERMRAALGGMTAGPLVPRRFRP
jgi:arylsulfatase A-like enzyme